MRSGMRLPRVLLLVTLATVVLSLTIALLSADTGLVEKVALVGMIGGCLVLVARVPIYVGRLQARLQRP